MAYSFAVKKKENRRRVSEKEIENSEIYTAKPAEFFETEPSVNTKQKSGRGNC